jgi:MbtH protein
MSIDVGQLLYFVVVNSEEQHSIWRADRIVPAGWHSVGPAVSKDQCLEYIRNAWTDMAPASLRHRVESSG